MSDLAEKQEGHGHGNGPKLVTIFVNTRPHKFEKDQISFEQVVKLAYPTTPPGADIAYSVMYERGQDGKEGTLVAGESVKAKDGMRFDVTATDRS
ncbi:MAG: multiubiquitin domain-containing protein [Acidimicrobiia bacterium]